LFANTKAALAEGAFGLPWFVARNNQGNSQSFWGFDHLAQVMDHLGLEVTDSIRALEHGWRSML
jgi:2-hydroxychromene-2-carboxylate isomerase